MQGHRDSPTRVTDRSARAGAGEGTALALRGRALGVRIRKWFSGPFDAARLLRIEVFLLTALPARLVIGPLGGVGAPSIVGGVLLLLLWLSAVASPRSGIRQCVPVRVVLALFWTPVLISYFRLNQDGVPDSELVGSDTFLVILLAFTGIVLVAAEGLQSREEVVGVIRAGVLGATFSAVLGLLQFVGFDLTLWMARIPILQENGAIGSDFARNSFNRPAGTALHPIEFGVVTSLTLAFALHLLLYDTKSSLLRRRAVFGVLSLGVPISISRSAMLVAIVVLVYFLLNASPALRLRAVAFLGAFVVFVFSTIPGLLGTLKALILAGQSDMSISTRTEDYAAVASFIRQDPWVGRGPGTFLPSYRILDNQFLLTLVEVGIIGFVALFVLFWTTSCLGRASLRHTRHQEADRNLSQMFAAAGTATIAAFLTFDALSFWTFTAYTGLWLGLAGSWWRSVLPGPGRSAGGTARDGAGRQVASGPRTPSPPSSDQA